LYRLSLLSQIEPDVKNAYNEAIMNFPPLRSLPVWLIASSGLILALMLAVTLALFGWFSPLFTALALIILSGSLGFAVILLIRTQDWARLTLIGTLALFALVIMLRTEPSVFSGRDQGSIALAAWNLAEYHELAFRTPAGDAFFNIYGPGRALNFPGFTYTEAGALITQFPIGYTSYLALFVSWFGIYGLSIGNAVLFTLSGWTLFELLSLFVSRRTALYATALYATAFLPVWLATLTLTENLAVFLFLSLALALVKLDREDDVRYLPLALTAGFLFMLTRIEGFAIAPLALAFILIRPRLRTHFLALPKTWSIPAFFFLGFLFLRDLFMNLPFYTVIGKAAVKFWHEIGNASNVGTADPALGPILFSYGLFPIFVLGIAALLFAFMKRRFTLLIPVLLALPTLLYLIDGHISNDHPWLLRRYAFTIFPLLVLALATWWHEWEARVEGKWKPRLVPVFFTLLFLLQIVPTIRMLSAHEYQGLLDQIHRTSTSFTDRDLILIDREVSGDPYAMIAGPMANLDGKNAVYFFNPEDLPRLDQSAFERTYLFTTEDSLGRYIESFGERLLPIEALSFSYPVLKTPPAYRFPEAGQVESTVLRFEVTP